MKRNWSPMGGFAFICARVARFSEDILERNGFVGHTVNCIGQVGTGQIFQALENGVDSVALLGCAEEECRHGIGVRNARKQVEISQRLLSLLGFNPQQVQFISIVSEGEVALALGQFPRTKEKCVVHGETVREEQNAGFGNGSGFVCIDCGRCSSVCPVSRTGLGFSPRRLIQQAETANKILPARVLYSCLGCDQCASVCPSGKSIAEEVLRLRTSAYPKGIAPVLAHGGVIQCLQRMMAKSSLPQNRIGWVDSTLRVVEKGEVALWTGCASYLDVLFSDLGVNLVETLRSAVRIMNRLGIEPVVLSDERCCGHDLLWLGDVGTVKKLAEHNLISLQSAGVKEVVFLCPECLRTFKVDYPRMVVGGWSEVKKKGADRLKFMHISEFLVERGFKPEGREKPVCVTYQDPCRLGRQLGIIDAPRQIITHVNGVEFREMAHNRSEGLCCGGTSWLECGAAVKLLQERRLKEAEAVEADCLITACGKCEIHFRCALESQRTNKALRIVNLVDFVSEKEQAER